MHRRMIICLVCCLLSAFCLLPPGTTQNRQYAKSSQIEAFRQQIFPKIARQIDISHFAKRDPDYKAHQKIIQNPSHSSNSEPLSIFHNEEGDWYAVSNQEPWILYSLDGTAVQVDIDVWANPTVSAAYCIQAAGCAPGTLLRATLYTAEGNSYIFLPDGKLSCYWSNGKCYSPDGNPCGTTKTNLGE